MEAVRWVSVQPSHSHGRLNCSGSTSRFPWRVRTNRSWLAFCHGTLRLRVSSVGTGNRFLAGTRMLFHFLIWNECARESVCEGTFPERACAVLQNADGDNSSASLAFFTCGKWYHVKKHTLPYLPFISFHRVGSLFSFCVSLALVRYRQCISGRSCLV